MRPVLINWIHAVPCLQAVTAWKLPGNFRNDARDLTKMSKARWNCFVFRLQAVTSSYLRVVQRLDCWHNCSRCLQPAVSPIKRCRREVRARILKYETTSRKETYWLLSAWILIAVAGACRVSCRGGRLAGAETFVWLYAARDELDRCGYGTSSKCLVCALFSSDCCHVQRARIVFLQQAHDRDWTRERKYFWCLTGAGQHPEIVAMYFRH